jgi:hypothetical protein
MGMTMEHQKPKAIDSYAVVDVQGWNPGVQFLKLIAVGYGIELVPQNQGQDERGEAKRQRGPAHKNFVAISKRKQNNCTNNWHDGQGGDPRERDHILAFQSSNIANRMRAPATILRYRCILPPCSNDKI